MISPRWIRTTPPPPPKPTHRLPSGELTSACTGAVGSGDPASAGGHDVKREPSNRRRPVAVPSHKYPSESCVIAKTSPGGRPFSEAQAVMAYRGVCGDWALARVTPIAAHRVRALAMPEHARKT